MTEQDAKAIIREKGMCGHVSGELNDRKICIQARGHDGGLHDRGWYIIDSIEPDPYAKDSRASITVYKITDGTRKLFSYVKADAEWLASTLTRLDL